MQKIIIKNFGAIKEAEIDIKQVLVLIGEQASGKSTIAKLIYFFQELQFHYFESIVNDNKISLEDLVKNKFYNFFGSLVETENFEIIFYFDSSLEMFISFHKVNNLIVKLSQEMKNVNVEKNPKNFKSLIDGYENLSQLLQDFELHKSSVVSESNSLIRLLISEHEKKILKTKEDFNKAIFHRTYDDYLLMIAGRSTTVQYNDLFEKQLYAFVQNKIENNKKQKFKLQEQTVDEILTMKFMEQVSKNRTIFERNGGTFESLLKGENKTDALVKAEKKIEEILKGKYSVDRLGERLLLKNETAVRLENASSGQQESIRILQDLFLVILKNEKTLRIIEEPEAHLFPIAQKQMVELLALMVNQNEGNTLIVTTHSPYILSEFNNLLFAQRVVQKNPETEEDVSKIIDKDFWLKSEEFTAYTLRDEEGGYVSESIMSDRSVIKQNYLDTVSDILGAEFNSLVSIHSKKFARK